MLLIEIPYWFKSIQKLEAEAPSKIVILLRK